MWTPIIFHFIPAKYTKFLDILQMLMQFQTTMNDIRTDVGNATKMSQVEVSRQTEPGLHLHSVGEPVQ